MDLPEALALAVHLHRGGSLEAAEEIYKRILDAAPEHPDALHFFGVLSHQLGRSDEAVRLIERSLEAAPDHVDAWSNLGNVQKERGRPEEALLAYRRAVSVDPGHANAWSNLGTVLGVAEEAEDCYRKAISIDPRHADAHRNLGNVLAARGRAEEAGEAYRRAIELKPGCGVVYQSLCASLRRAGRIEEADATLREWLAFKPDDPIARHLKSAGAGGAAPGRASDEYVRALFDESAPSYDERLKLLDYRGARLVAEALAEQGPASGDLDVLDAGCGTGLCAPVLRPYARRLVGVDLSPGMLARARRRGGYDELVEGELTAHLTEVAASQTETAGGYDLVASADTLNYFGDHGPVLEAAAGALRPGGRLVYTVERSVEQDEGAYRLELHGRYSHTEAYVRRSLAQAGFEMASVVEAALRREVDEPVAGLVVTAVKPASVREGLEVP